MSMGRDDLGLDSPVVKVVAQAVGDMMRQQSGVDMNWHLVETTIEHGSPMFDMAQDINGHTIPVSGGMTTTRLTIGLIGGVKSEETKAVTQNVEEFGRQALREMEVKLMNAQAAQVAAETELDAYKDEESQLIRRIAAKTKMRHGVEPADVLGPFLRWFLERTGTEFDQAKWAECFGVVSGPLDVGADGLLESSPPLVTDLTPDDVVSVYCSIQKTAADAMVAPDNDGGEL